MTPLITPARSGVYRAPVHLDTVRHSAEPQALWIEIDLTPMKTKGDLLDALANAFGLPPAFGHNWDALADVLQDLSTRPANGWVLCFTHGAQASRVLGVEWARLREVLAQTATYWKQRSKAFVVFIEDGAELPPWI